MSTYQRTAKGEKFAAKALTKCIVYFLDGNSRTWHSRDYRGSNPKADRELGLTRLKNWCIKNSSSIETATIYDNVTGEELYKFRKGVWS